MAKDSGRNLALIMLGIVAIIAVVGMVLLYTGAKSGKVARQVYSSANIGPYQGQYYPSPEEACWRAIHCQDGVGAVLVGTMPDAPNIAVCVCPEHHHPETVFDSTALRRGETPAPLDWTKQHYRKVVWKPQSAIYSSGERQATPILEKPGTYPSGYYRERQA